MHLQNNHYLEGRKKKHMVQGGAHLPCSSNLLRPLETGQLRKCFEAVWYGLDCAEEMDPDDLDYRIWYRM
jgi:hypothetical protein